MGVPDVRITYHWLRANGDPYEPRGHRTALPHTLGPGQSTRLPVSVRAPGEPGDYILQWDMVIPQVAWFSKQGWRGPEYAVRVAGE
jgi:hypothetical protein